MRQWAKTELKCSNYTSLPWKTEWFICLMDGSSWELLCNPTAIPQKTILMACQINNGNCWLLEFEKPMEMDYNILQHLHWGRRKGWLTPHTGRSGSTCRNIKPAPNPSLPEQLRSIITGILEVAAHRRLSQLFTHWSSGYFQAFHFLTRQPLPQVPGILWRFGKASECFS